MKVLFKHIQHSHKGIFLILLFFICPFIFIAQDKIHLKSGIIIDAKITEIKPDNIDYKKFSNQNGPTLSVKKNDVKMVVYEDGKKETFFQSSGSTYESKYLKSVADDEGKNPDKILTIKNEQIFCHIDNDENGVIKYHINRTGPDPQSIINMSQVQKYYFKRKWKDGYGNSVEVSEEHSKARSYVLADNKIKALQAYSELIAKDSSNTILMAEAAYVMALNKLYDGALYRLDRCWSVGNRSSDLNFFTAQVYALMGYKELSNEFWKESEKNKIPEWIKNKYATLLEKYMRENEARVAPSPEEIASKFNIANSLAADNRYIQSIGLFQEITYFYPNEYLPYVGYSITLEKAGAINKSIESIEKAISLLGNTAEDKASRAAYEERLKELNKRLSKLPPNTLPGLYQVNLMDMNRPQVMTYFGGMVSPNMTSINARVGYFVTGKSNGSVDFSYMKGNSYSYTNFGLSIYTRSKVFVSGVGLSLNSYNGNVEAFYKISAGISIMNKKKSTSFDVFGDVNRGFKNESLSTFGISVGTSFYFGRRK